MKKNEVVEYHGTLNSEELDKTETMLTENELAIYGNETTSFMTRDEKGLKVPFGFSVGVFSVAGIINIEKKFEESNIKFDIFVTGSRVGTITLNKDKTNYEISVGLAKLRIGVDFTSKVLFWQIAELRVKWDGWKPIKYWKWHGRNTIYNF